MERILIEAVVKVSYKDTGLGFEIYNEFESNYVSKAKMKYAFFYDYLLKTFNDARLFIRTVTYSDEDGEKHVIESDYKLVRDGKVEQYICDKTSY